jgi:hypothetical protein
MDTCIVKSRNFGDVVSEGLFLPLSSLSKYGVYFYCDLIFNKKFNRIETATGIFSKTDCRRARNGKNKRGGKDQKKWFFKYDFIQPPPKPEDLPIRLEKGIADLSFNKKGN